MKFLAWFFAFLVFFYSFFAILTFNLHQTFLTPEKTKQMLITVDFYGQMKSVLKKDLFEAEGANTADVNVASKAVVTSLEQYDFQPKIEGLITDFYKALDTGSPTLTVDLVDFKSVFLKNISAATDPQSAKEINTAIPDRWQIDMSKYSMGLSVVAFTYHNYNLILIIYGVLVFLFLLFCLLVSTKYLKLFFWVFIVVGLLILIQRLLWQLVNPTTMFQSLISQGRSGLGVLVENFVDFFKRENSKLLMWESIYIIAPAVIGLIIVSVIPTKVGSIPLSDTKTKQ